MNILCMQKYFWSIIYCFCAVCHVCYFWFAWEIHLYLKIESLRIQKGSTPPVGCIILWRENFAGIKSLTSLSCFYKVFSPFFFIGFNVCTPTLSLMICTSTLSNLFYLVKLHCDILSLIVMKNHIAGVWRSGGVGSTFWCNIHQNLVWEYPS